MGGRRTQKPLPGDGRRQDADGVHGIRDGNADSAATAATGMSARLASELFARLLLELPGHRHELESACRDGSREHLSRAAHKLLGVVVYCDLPDLAEALRDLKRAIAAPDAGQTEAVCFKTIRLIDELLASSGYRGD